MSASIPQAPLAEVRGKVAFVTGGSSGIGLGLARALRAAAEPNPPGAPFIGPVRMDRYCVLPTEKVIGVPSAAVAA